VDVLIAIRQNFFYTRTVPCELWHFDKGKPKERRDQVLMLDARQVFRKVTRKIYDFSPEQLANLAAIVWLYRGQQTRFLDLLKSYFAKACAEGAKVASALGPFDAALKTAVEQMDGFAMSLAKVKGAAKEEAQAYADGLAELSNTVKAYRTDRASLLTGLAALVGSQRTSVPATNKAQHAARKLFDPLAERLKGLTKQIDLIYKECARIAQLAIELGANDSIAPHLNRRALTKSIKEMEELRRNAIEQLKHSAYFHRQIAWLQDRFPKAEIEAVPGLCKVVTQKEIEKAEWSLTPGRYVGVAPMEFDEDFDFERALKDIHVELADLNAEAAELAAKIQTNFEGLGA
jgi:type I restriction enzyme M protein